MPQVFDKEWFAKHQKSLLWFLNTPIINRWFRKTMRIKKYDCSIDTKIARIEPNAITIYQGLVKVNGENHYKLKTGFETHQKYAKRLRYAFYPLWMTMHIWDFFADAYAPKLSFGFLTLTARPTSGTGGPASDAFLAKDSTDTIFSTIRAAAGTTSGEGSGSLPIVLDASATTNQFNEMDRGLTLYDTSSLTGSAVISSAVLSLFFVTVFTGFGSTNNSIDIVSATPSVNFNFATSDFNAANFGTTSFANIAVSSITTSAFNDFTLSAGGISNISKTGISKFGQRTHWDMANSFDATWASGAQGGAVAKQHDFNGDTDSPKLVVTYTIPVSGGAFLFNLI